MERVIAALPRELARVFPRGVLRRLGVALSLQEVICI